MLSCVQQHLNIRGPHGKKQCYESKRCKASRAIDEKSNSARDFQCAADQYKLKREGQKGRHYLHVRFRYYKVHDAGDNKEARKQQSTRREMSHSGLLISQ